MRTVTVTDLVRSFNDYVNRVVYRGESFRLTRNDRVVAELRPAPIGGTLGELPDLISDLPSLSEHEAASFADDLSRARQELTAQPLKDPWAS